MKENKEKKQTNFRRQQTSVENKQNEKLGLIANLLIECFPLKAALTKLERGGGGGGRGEGGPRWCEGTG